MNSKGRKRGYASNEFDWSAWGLEPPPRTLPDDDPLLWPTDENNSPARQALRKRLVNKELEKVKHPGAQPTLYLIGGGSASGKGTLLKLLKNTQVIPEGSVLEIDPDALKDKLPEYLRIIEKGDSRAAAVVHEESKQLAEKIFHEALERRLNIVLNRTMCNRDAGVRLIEEAKAAGYKVWLFGVTVDVRIAVGRAAKRAHETNRYVSIDTIIATHKGFSQAFPVYAKHVDRAELRNNEGEPEHPIAVAEGDRIEVLDQDAYDEFLSKERLNIEAKRPEDLRGREDA